MAGCGESWRSGSLLLDALAGSPEGRPLWETRVAPVAGGIAALALAQACRTGRALAPPRRRNRLRLLDAVQTVGEMRAALAVGLPVDSTGARRVARHISADVLAFMLDNTRASPDFLLWADAARAERERLEKLEVLYIRAPRNSFNAHACAAAAQCGFLDALRWLHEHGCPWDDLVCRRAVRSGNLEALQFAVWNGCPWSFEESLAVAQQARHEHILAWMAQLQAEGAGV